MNFPAIAALVLARAFEATDVLEATGVFETTGDLTTAWTFLADLPTVDFVDAVLF